MFLLYTFISFIVQFDDLRPILMFMCKENTVIKFALVLQLIVANDKRIIDVERPGPSPYFNNSVSRIY